MRSRSGRAIVVATVLMLLGAMPVVRAASPPASACVPGDAGCLPTPEQCATGAYNGYWDGGAPGRLALCIGAAGHVALYVGGTVQPLCGAVVVAYQAVAGDPAFDPNECLVGFPPSVTVRHERVTSHDGVPLDGWVLLPPHAEGEALPVVLDSGPYFGQQAATGDRLTDWFVPVRTLLDHGFAVALFNVRGTGNSGGCFELNGPNEQLDQGVLVEWLAAQRWSNERVGMVGLSYDGTTPWEAATNPEAAPHLATIVVAGTISDRYLMQHTPQGATVTDARRASPLDPFFPDYVAHQSVIPPAMGALLDPGYWLFDHAPVLAERVCPEVVRVYLDRNVDGLLDDRDEEFWRARRLIDRFDDVTASVFLTHGFHDDHAFQEDIVWDALTQAPKRMLEGQWGHAFPTVPDWEDRVIAWLDATLKSDGSGAPGLGVVDYQDSSGTWHGTTAWPPAEARSEVLYLAGDGLSAASGSGARSFQWAPSIRNAIDGTNGAYQSMVETLCPTLVSTATGTAGLLYTAAASSGAVIAGNPFAFLRVTSDMPGGMMSAALYDLAPDFHCEADGTAVGAVQLSAGAVDLRFHGGGYMAQPFPVGSTEHVRIDFPNLAHRLDAGHRVAFAVGYAGNDRPQYGLPYAPNLTISAAGGALASHLVLPVVSGTLGGVAPTLTYPPRPFTPAPS